MTNTEDQFPVEVSLTITLQNLSYELTQSDRSRELETVRALIRELSLQALRVYGNASVVSAEAIDNLARLEREEGRDEEAERLHKQSLSMKMKLLGDDVVVAESLRAVAQFHREDELGQALVHRARLIEEQAGVRDPVEATFQELANNSALPEEMRRHFQEQVLESPDMDTAAMNQLIEDYLSDSARNNEPETSPITSEERFRRVMDIATRGFEIMEPIEADAPYPLGTICMLSVMSDCHRHLGNIPDAKALLERELAIIAKHWGSNHVMMTETLDKLGRLTSGQS